MIERWSRIPALLLARRNLRRAPIRSGLASLGIVIGVFAIASLGIFGATLQTAVTGSLGDIGNQLVIQPAGEEGDQRLTERELRELRQVVDTEQVVPISQARANLRMRDTEQPVTTYGISDPDRAFSATAGRIPSPLRNGVLVGADLGDRLAVRPGSSLTIGGKTYRIQAILAPQNGLTPLNIDSAIIVPATDLETTGYSMALVTAASGQEANESAMAIRSALNERTDRVTVFELGQLVDQIESVFDAVNLFLLAIGSISLVVAGVSILNVMLMSAIERREEIGVLRAVGFQQRDVLAIMLVEALLLGVVGSLIGVLLSLGAGLIINELMLGAAGEVLSHSTGEILLTAVAVGLMTSLVSGVYPAYKAANNRPVEVLRE